MRLQRFAPAADEHRYLGFVDLTPGNRQYHFGERIFRCIEVLTVQQQEHQRHHCTDPFVPVRKGILLGQVKEAGRSQLNIAFGLLFNLIALLAGAGGQFTPIMGVLVHNIGTVLGCSYRQTMVSCGKRGGFFDI